METKKVDNLSLFFDIEEREAAETIAQACQKSIQIIHQNWGLATPEDCRVYVLSSLLHFSFHSAPWGWRVLLGITLPLWYPRQQRIWRYAGGYAQQYGQRRAIGVKPPRLLAVSDRSIGDRVFAPVPDLDEKVGHITCHELTHAFCHHLKLPVWLQEGLAMLTVDKFAGKPTIKAETLDVLAQSPRQQGVDSYRKLSPRDPEAMIFAYVQGYWLVRYLHETQPGLLPSLLVERQTHEALETKVAAALDLNRDEFWQQIDGLVVAHLKKDDPDNDDPR